MFAYCINNPICLIDACGFVATKIDLTDQDKDGDGMPDEPAGVSFSSTDSSSGGDTTPIYRWGGISPGNLTPRAVDVNSGLSFSTQYKPGSAQTTIEKINATGVLYAWRDSPTHISVIPVNATMVAWYEMGKASIWTTTLQSVVEKAR